LESLEKERSIDEQADGTAGWRGEERRRWDGKLVILVSQFDIRSTCEHPSPIQFMPYINTINPGSVEITVNRARAALDMRLSTLSNRPRYLRHYA
jgi:hypothetical protein